MTDQSVIELLIQLRDNMSEPSKKAGAEIGKLGQALKKFEEHAKHFKSLFYAGAAMEGMALGIGASLKHFAGPALAFQRSQQDLERATHLSAAQLAGFQRQAMHLSDRLPQSAAEITQAQANLVRTLGSSKAAMETVGIAAKFATGTQTDMKAATDLLATAYENVGDKALPLKAGFSQIANELSVLQNKFSTSRENGEMLVRSFARLSGVAKVSGINTTQLMAALGVLNKSGFAGGRGASDYLSQALERLGELGKNGIPTIEKYGIMLAGSTGAHGTFHLNLLQTLKNMQQSSPMRLQAYLKSLGQVGGTLKVLMDRYGQVTGAMKTFEHSQGATNSLAAQMNQGWNQQLKELHNAWTNLEISLGSVLVPLLVKMAHVLEPIIERFRKFAVAHTTLMKVGFVMALLVMGGLVLQGAVLILASAFGALSAASAVVGAAIAGATSTVWTFTASLLADPVFDFIAAVVLLAIGAYELVHHWQTVKGFFERLWPVITRPFIEAWESIEAFGHRVEGWALDLLGWFGNHPIFAALMGPIGWLMMAADELVKHWKKVEAFFDHLAGEIGGVFKSVENFLHLGHHAAPLHATSKHHTIMEHVAKAARAVPAAVATGMLASTAAHAAAQRAPQFERLLSVAPAAKSGIFSPQLAPAPSSSVQGGVHFHAHIEGGATGADSDSDAFADKMLHAMRTRQNDFVSTFAEINDQTHGQWTATGF